MDPPFKTARAQSELFAVLCRQWDPIWNSQLIRRYQLQWQIYRYIETNAHRYQSQIYPQTHTHTKFKMKYPDRFLLTSSGQE